jgi:ribonuclease HI
MEPIELPNGHWVCSAHYLTVCGKCCVDYTFMDEINEDEDGEESDGKLDSDAEDSDQVHVVSDQERNEMMAYGERHEIPNSVSLSSFPLLTCHQTYGSY